MAHVKIDIKTWIDEVIQELKDRRERWYSKTGNVYHDPAWFLLHEFKEWALNNCVGSIVPTPKQMAAHYIDDGAFMRRGDEDEFLINEMKIRTQPMTDAAWEAYCKEKNALFYSERFACLSDGYFWNPTS